MKNPTLYRIILILILGIIIGMLDPLRWLYWKIAEVQLPSIKKESLASQSPFEQNDKSQ